MKKNLLTLMFVIAFICVGVSVASAKNASSLGNSVAVSKRLSPAKIISNKIKALKARCGVDDCGHELSLLLNINDIYEDACAPDYIVGCDSGLEAAVIKAGEDYEACLNSGPVSKNLDKTMNRNKTIKASTLFQTSKSLSD